MVSRSGFSSLHRRMFEISNEKSDSDEPLEEESESLCMSREAADALFNEVGCEVAEEEDPINFHRYNYLFSDKVHLNLMELLEEVKLPFKLAEFQTVALHSIGSGKNTVLISPTGKRKI